MWCCKYHVVKCAYGVWIAARRGDSISLFPQIGFLPDILWASNHSIKNVDQSFTFSPKFSLKSCGFRLFHFWRLPQYLNMPVRYGSFIFQVLDNAVYEKNIWICQSCDAYCWWRINTEKIVCGYIKDACKVNNILRWGNRYPHFPCIYARTGYPKQSCKLCLRQALLFP